MPKEAIKQRWSDGKKKQYSYHRSYSEIDLFGQEINKDRWWITDGKFERVLVMPETMKRIEESQYGIWMK